MTSIEILFLISLYFILLGVIAFFSRRKTQKEMLSFFVAERKAPWWLIAYGMIGTALSGVTFISVPGTVGKQAMSYFQIVLGYFVGYLLIAFVLLPIYYRLNLISIYGYLENSLGKLARKLASIFFIVSRLLGASARLYLSIFVLQFLVFDKLKIPIELTTTITVLFIYFYTRKTGLKTIIKTDFLQTSFMLASLIITLIFIANALENPWETFWQSEYSRIFVWDIRSSSFFGKAFLTGVLIAFTMTGLDQDQMQKNLSIASLKDARKNVIAYGFAIVLVNFLFLMLGGFLFLYAEHFQVTLPEKTDNVFPMLATQHFPAYIGVLFIIGLIAATYSSADGSITALTTSFLLDLREINPEDDKNVPMKRKIHLMFSVAVILSVLAFYYVEQFAKGSWSIIHVVLRLAAYTYGPLLGLFLFPMFFKNFRVKKPFLVTAMFLSPALGWVLDINDTQWFAGFQIGHELILINAIFTGIILMLGKEKKENSSLKT